MPPGTGDVHLTLANLVPAIQNIIVTTPNADAAHVAIRSGLFSIELNQSIVGIVENMSYYKHNNEKINVLGTGGGETTATALNSTVIAEIPFYQERHTADAGFSQLYDSLISIDAIKE